MLSTKRLSVRRKTGALVAASTSCLRPVCIASARLVCAPTTGPCACRLDDLEQPVLKLGAKLSGVICSQHPSHCAFVPCPSTPFWATVRDSTKARKQTTLVALGPWQLQASSSRLAQTKSIIFWVLADF